MTGLEPATSGVTGRCSNQLSYIPSRARHYSPDRAFARISGAVHDLKNRILAVLAVSFKSTDACGVG